MADGWTGKSRFDWIVPKGPFPAQSFTVLPFSNFTRRVMRDIAAGLGIRYIVKRNGQYAKNRRTKRGGKRLL